MAPGLDHAAQQRGVSSLVYRSAWRQQRGVSSLVYRSTLRQQRGVCSLVHRSALRLQRGVSSLVYQPGIPDGLGAPTERIHEEPLEMPSGLRSTMNCTGYEFAQPSPLLHYWIASYDQQHPLLDIGCAYGALRAQPMALLNES